MFMFGLLLLVVGGFAAAAAISVSAERQVSAQIASDVDGAAIQFKGNHPFEEVLVVENGVVSFDLDAALEKQAFNNNAEFTIGDNKTPVFTITNNLPDNSPIKVGFEGAYVSLHDESGQQLSQTNRVTIGSGESKSFYFVVSTNDAGAPITEEEFNSAVKGTLFID